MITPQRRHLLRLALASWPMVLAMSSGPRAENIDPNNNSSQYAWAENVGWMNAEPLGDGGSGVHVEDFELTGWMWSENTGWISLSCENTASCATVSYGVGNDTYGALFGFGWSENRGWVNFRPPGGGVAIDPITGEFSGRAWGENIGWITFGSSGPIVYKIMTSWTCNPNPGAVATLHVTHDHVLGRTAISWGTIPLAFHYNTYRGTIPIHGMSSRLTHYDHVCFESDDSSGDGLTESRDPALPALETAYYYLVSGERNCEGPLGAASNGSTMPNFSACPTPP